MLCVLYKHHEISSLSLLWNSTITIVLIKFQTNLKIYVEITSTTNFRNKHKKIVTEFSMKFSKQSKYIISISTWWPKFEQSFPREFRDKGKFQSAS